MCVCGCPRADQTAAAFAALAEQGIAARATLFGHLGDQDVWNYHLVLRIALAAPHRHRVPLPPRAAAP